MMPLRRKNILKAVLFVLVLMGCIIFQRSRRVYPNNLYNHGLWRMEKREYDLAIKDFTKSLQVEGRLASTYWRRGCTYLILEKYDLAISDLTESVEIGPPFADAFALRAEAYYHKQEYDKAWEDIRKVRSLWGQPSPEFLGKLREASGKQE